MGIVAGTIGRTVAFWAVMLFALAVGHIGGWSDRAVGTLGMIALFGGPFLAYYRTTIVARERQAEADDRQASAIAEGIRRARDAPTTQEVHPDAAQSGGRFPSGDTDSLSRLLGP